MTEEDNDDEAILKNYEATARWVEKMNLPGQIFSILVTCWREDCFYGYCYYDDSEDQDVNSFIILPLDPQYCRISSVNYDGTLNMAYDFSFFNGSTNAKYLEWYDKEFTTLYNAYQKLQRTKFIINGDNIASEEEIENAYDKFSKKRDERNELVKNYNKITNDLSQSKVEYLLK